MTIKDVRAFANLAVNAQAVLNAKRTSLKKGRVEVYGAIGGGFWSDGISAKQFAKAVKDLGDVETIEVYINSEGGSVTEGRDMYNTLVQHKATVEVEIGGLAASAATFLAMAGDTIRINEGALFMIHNASLITWGDARAHEASAKLLHTVNDIIIDTYMARTGIARSRLVDWMNDETWFSGKEAVDHGFATDLIPNKTGDAENTSKLENALKFAADRVQLQNIVACGQNRVAFNKVPPQLQPNRAAAQAILARHKGLS